MNIFLKFRVVSVDMGHLSRKIKTCGLKLFATMITKTIKEVDNIINLLLVDIGNLVEEIGKNV